MQRTSKLINEKYRENLLASIGLLGSISIAGTVDRIMVGNFLGAQALAAVSLNSPVVSAINVIIALFVFGGNTLAVTRKAQRQENNANKVFTISVVLGTAIMTILAAIAFVFCHEIAAVLCRSNAELTQMVLEYLVPTLVLGPLGTVTLGCCQYVRVDGMPKLSLLIPVVSNVVNLFCDYLFMRVMNYGIAGAGWATNVGYVAGIFCLVFYFVSKTRSFHFTRIGLADISLLIETLKTGLASALGDGCMFIQMLVMNLLIIASFGAVGAQVIAVCLSALSIAGVLYRGTTQAMLSIGAALYGEKDSTGFCFLMRSGTLMTEAFMIALTVLLEIFAEPFGRLFGVNSSETMELLSVGFRLYLLYLPLIGIQECVRVCLQSTNRRSMASILTALSGAICFVPVAWIFSVCMPSLIWLSYAVAIVLGTGAGFIYMYIKSRGKQTPDAILLPKFDEEGVTYEFSIENSIEAAVKASESIISFCRDNGINESLSNQMGIATEELCTNIAKYAYVNRDDFADLFLKINKNAIILCIRDNGVIFNPTEFFDDDTNEISGLGVLGALPVKKEYNRILGFNNTVITIEI